MAEASQDGLLRLDRRLRAELRRIVGREGVLERRVPRKAYESDAYTFERAEPDLVVLPLDTEQAARVLRRLAEAGVPVIPRGAGTGLTGGATAVGGGVIVGTARMRRILALDPDERWARVQAGVINIDLTAAAAPGGLFYAPDPSSQRACTIGGNVANNSGGPHCFRYGSTHRHIRGLVLVDAEGEVLDLSAPEIDPLGYDLVGAIVGCEGLFGLVTEVVVNLEPVPAVTETLLALYPELDQACDTVSAAIAARLEPSALEILDRLTIEAVEASVLAAGYPRDVGAVLLVEIEGSEEEVAAQSAAIERIAREHGAREVRRARDAEERARLWAGRKAAFGAMGRVAPDLLVADVVVPRTRLREVVARATEICHAKGLKVANVFHAGDGNLHPNISFDRRDADEVRRVREAAGEIMELVVSVGGSLSGEHGIGLEKRDHLRLVFTKDDLDAMAAVRRAFDPKERMNPGKSIPVRGCLEVPTRPLPTGDSA